MKTFVLLFSILASSTSFADTLNGVLSALSKYEGKTGYGYFTKNGKTSRTNHKCYIGVNNIDSWSSDYAVTADILEITVGGERIGTDLQSWDFKNGKLPSSNGTRKYRDAYTGTNRCNYVNTLIIDSIDGVVSYQETKKCKNGVNTNKIYVCSF